MYIIIYNSSTISCIWLVIITTAERTVSIVWPFKITKIFSKMNCSERSSERLVLTLPYSLFELMRKTLHNDTFYSIIPKDRVRDFQRATLLLIDLNHSTNFIFYVLAAERFRNRLIKILTFWKKINTKEKATYSKTNQTVEIGIKFHFHLLIK